MTQPASEASEPPPSRRRGQGLHPTGQVVAVVGLLAAVIGFVIVYRDVNDRRDERLQEAADTAAEEVTDVLADVEDLVTGLESTLIARGEPNQFEVERLLRHLLERSDRIQGATLLQAEEGTLLDLFGQAGESPFLDLEGDPDAVAQRVGELADLADGEVRQVGVVETPDGSLVALATAFTTESPTGEGPTRSWVVQVEMSFPPGSLTELDGLPGRPDLSVYAADEPDAEALLFSTGPTGDGGRTAERAVPLGSDDALLVIRPTGDLLDRTEESLPLFVFLGILALTALLTPLVARLASRREEVRALSAQRDELDDALTASRRIEQELRSSEQRFRSVLDSSPDVVLWIDEDVNTLQVLNRDDFLGHPLDDVVTIRGLEALAHPDDAPAAREGFAALRVASAGTITEFECRFVRPDGEWEWLRVRGGRVQRDEPVAGPVLAVLTNVTDQKHEEERRAILETQLVQSQRLEAVGQLAGGVAHDFNNILAAIVSGAELVLDDVDGQTREDVEEIRRTARRGSDLARQLLLFSRRDRGSAPEVVDVNRVIADVETMLRRTLDESIELETRLADEVYEVHIDPSQIERVLMNLTINARDAMPTGGRITVSTENVDADGEFVATRPGLEPGPYVQLTVADSGSGMPEDVKRHAFEPFFSTKEVGKGTGLGLATVYGIVQGAQGHIELESEVGRGTRFRILLPRTRLGRVDEHELPEEGEEHGGSERLLLVEDEATVREATRRLLEKNGYWVDVAADGNEAVARAADDLDVLVTDILMPGGLNGRDVAHALRRLHPRIAVLYMTGHSDDVLDTVGIDDDRDHEALVLRKPFTEDELLRALRLAISRIPEPAR